jgi:translation elongation factor P/translation initiation factor 5A
MKTYRARDLTKGQVIIKENEYLVIDKVDSTKRGNVIVWVNNKINQTIIYNPMDVVLLK